MKGLFVLISIIGVILLGTASFAGSCTDPVPAPKYQVGDKFTWQYTNGKVKVWEVKGFEGNLAEVNWSDGEAVWASDSEGTYFLDQDWVIRKGINKKGEVFLASKFGAFSLLGVKGLDFPLQIGKTWYFTAQSKGTSGGGQLGDGPTDWTLRVVGCEETATLAGKFLALKIEVTEIPRVANSWGTRYWWYSPEAKNIVKVEFGRWAGSSGVHGGWSTRPIDYELLKLELK